MDTRVTQRPARAHLEGRSPREVEVIHGSRYNGTPAVAVTLSGLVKPARFTVTDPDVLEALAHELITAADYLRGAAVS
jgi:hypothetical protein